MENVCFDFISSPRVNCVATGQNYVFQVRGFVHALFFIVKFNDLICLKIYKYMFTFVRILAIFLQMWENIIMGNKFAENFKTLRLEKGLGQEKLSKELKVSKGIISLWETGLREPSMSSLILVARYFDVSIDWLVGLKDA